MKDDSAFGTKDKMWYLALNVGRIFNLTEPEP